MVSQFDDFSNPFANFSGFGIPEVKEEEALQEPAVSAFGGEFSNPAIPEGISQVKEEALSQPELEASVFGGEFSNPAIPEEISEVKANEPLLQPELEASAFGGGFSNLGILEGIPEVKEEPMPKTGSVAAQQPAVNVMQEILVTEQPKQTTIDLSIFEIDSMDEGIPTENDFSNGLLLDATISAYDSEFFQAELPAYPVYCTIEMDPNLVSKDPEWVEMCMQACPSAASEMLKHLTEWIQEKIHLFQTPKISAPDQKWGITEILQQKAVLDELERSYRIIWQNAVQLAEGNEPVEWIASVAISMLLRHLTSFFVLQVR